MKTTALFLTLASALLINGCAAPPPVVEIDQAALGQAATQTLQEAVYYSAIFSTCAALGGDVEVEVISKQHDWTNANTNLVLAADQIYSQQHANNTFEYQGKTLSPAAVRLALESRLRAVNELKLDQRTPINQVKACEYRLSKITGNVLDLSQTPWIAPYASEILKHSPLDQQLDEVPALAGGITEVPPGPTYFTLVKNHEAACQSTPLTLSIINQWPKEVYANFCGDTSVELLTCDWGKCEAKKL